MTDHVAETATDIAWSRYQMDLAIDERVMSPTALGR
jgi:hypothetical protein